MLTSERWPDARFLLKKKPELCAVRLPNDHETAPGYGLLHTCCSRAVPESLTQFIWEHSP